MIKITTFVGKDVEIWYDLDDDSTKEQVLLAQDFSFEYDNGKNDIRAIGFSTIQEYNFTGISVTGTITVAPQGTSADASMTNLFALVDISSSDPQTDEDMEVRYGSGPDYTLTITDVAFGKISTGISLEDTITFEMPFTGKNITIT